MTRVNQRPGALLDGASEASRIVLPGSDAERYFDSNRVNEKIPDFMGHLALLSSSFYGLSGSTKTLTIDGQRMIAIQGENVPNGEAEPMYAFTLGPDAGEFIEVSRIMNGHGTTLSWAEPRNEAKLVFRTPDLRGLIDNSAQIAELEQIIAAGQDATEWTLN